MPSCLQDDLTNPLAAAFARGTLAFQLYTLQDPENVVGNILHKVGTDAFSLLTNYEQMILAQAAGFEKQHADILPTADSYGTLFPQVFQGPAPLAASMLLSLSHLASQRPQRIDAAFNYQILQLRGYIIRQIDAALRDPKRCMTDHACIAILLLATVEALHGLRKSYDVHMTGMMNLINLRGGLRALGFGGHTEAFILWQDNNLANIIGGTGYSHLAMNPSSKYTVKADRDHFLWGAEANVKVIEEDEVEGNQEDNPMW